MPQAKSDLREMVSIKSVHDATQFPPAECQRMVDFLVGAFTEVGLQDVRGYDALRTGMAFLVPTAVVVTGPPRLGSW